MSLAVRPWTAATAADSIRRITRDVLLMPDPATAVVASDGLIALSIVEAIQELGLAIPADVSFLMYDDFAWTRLTTPAADSHLAARP